MNALAHASGSLVCEVSSLLGLALLRAAKVRLGLASVALAIVAGRATPLSDGGNREGIIALELACSSSAVTLPGGSPFKSIRCGTQNRHPQALSVDKSGLLAS
jgi:hypothetical protein